MKYIGENAIKKLIALIKGDLAKKQNSITVSGLLKGDGTTISAAVAGTDYAAASHNHDSSYLKLSGGKLTGNLTGKYITGTWLQTTEATALGSAATKICALDGSGWIYYRTPEQILSDIKAATVDHNHYGRVIQPTSIELSPGKSAGHGGYIDFHFNGDAADYTSRIYEPVKGVLKYNNHGILSTANIVALFNVNITFTNGVATYENSAIKSSSVTFVQWRAGAVATLQDSVLSTTPQNGSMKIIAKSGITGGPLPVNILIINL